MTDIMKIKDTNVDVWNMEDGSIMGDGENFGFTIKEYKQQIFQNELTEIYLNLSFVTVDGYEYKFCCKVDSIEKVEN